MKKATTLYYFLLLTLGYCMPAFLSAQVVVTNGTCNLGINIPDNNCVQVDLPITTAPGIQLGQDVFLEEVKIIIRHPWRNDLQVNLIAPDGITEIKLINERGGSSDHFGNPDDNSCTQAFVLSNSPCSTDSVKNITSSSESIGVFVPEEPFSDFHLLVPFNPNATWKLEVCDDKFGDIGTLEFIELIFVPQGCPAPTNLAAFNVTATTIDLGWDNNGQCDNVVVEYGPEGFTPGNGTVAGSANSQVVVLNCVEEFDLTNLSQLTNYDIYVRQICNAYNYAYNSCKVTNETDCILPPVTLLENFDDQIGCGSDGGACIDCPTVDGVWKNATNDDIDWIVNSGSTVTSNTGPSIDADVNGQYIYIESSSTCKPNKEAILISDCIEVDASSGICHLSFFYHMFGININALFLEATTDGTNWTTLWSESGNQGDQWIRQYINLSAYDNQVVQFRFRGVSAAINFRGDIGLDRIAFYGSQLKASAIFYADTDNDSFGDPMDSIAVCFAAQPTGYVANNLDCDDMNPAIHPDAVEIPCNGIDENCNGSSDDAVIFSPSFSISPICSGEMATITVTPSNAGQVYWFLDAVGSTLLDSGTVFSTGLLSATTTFYFQETEIFSGQTCSSNIIPVEVIVNPKPSITNASGDQSICENTAFDLSTLIIQDANNALDTLLFFTNDSYAPNAQIQNPIVAISSDSIFYIQARSNSGCTDELAVNFSKIPAPSVNIDAPDTLALCFQSAPQLISAMEMGGGIGPFDFNWSTGAQGEEVIVFSRSKDFYQTVSVTVTSQGNGCIATDQIVVHTLPSVSTIEVTDIQEPGFCQSNGAIIVEPKDGLAPYSYSWNGAVSGTESNISTTDYTVNNLETGAYNITVTDNFGCSKNIPQQFVNGADLGIDNITDVSCFGANDGAITISVGGLTNPTYQWSDGTSVISNFQNVSALSGGVYSVIVDADNVAPCLLDSIVVSEPPLLEIFNENITPPSCAGLVDAAIDLTVTGGTPNSNSEYNFSWSNGLGNNSNPQNLSPATYNVTITDANNCVLIDTITVTPTPVLEVDLIGVDPKCFEQNDGTISSTVIGGTAPYTYEWNDDLVQTTATAFGLLANNYELKVTDANGCETVANTTLNDPIILSAQVSNIKSPLCNEINDGEIDLSVSGGTGTYQYLWSNTDTTTRLTAILTGVYAVTVSDENDCRVTIDSIAVTAPDLMDITFPTLENPLCEGVDNGTIEASVNGGVAPYAFAWNTGATAATINNLAADDYFVEVTDRNGCIALSDTITLIAPQLITVDDFLVIDSIQCKGSDNGVVFYRMKSAAPGANNFSFQWKDSTLITDISNGLWLSSDYTTLTAGNYGLEIKDNLGCFLQTDFEITEPDFLQIDTILIEAPSCFGESDGNALATIQGGTGPFTYSWRLPNNRIVRTTEGVLQNIDGGNYILEIIDANNCVSSAYNFNVESSSPIQLAVAEVRNVSCSSPESGFIDINASGGREGIQFEWNNGLLTEDLTNLDAGVYSVTITDGAECTLTRSFEIELEEDSLDVELITLENPDCDNTANGAISIKVNGGFGSYQYFWNNGTQLIDGDATSLEALNAGTYAVSVVDRNNDYLCVGALENIVLLPQGNISVSLDEFDNQLDCFGDSNGRFLITPTGGVAPYQFLWSNGATTEDIQNLTAGNYTLTITDANNCEWVSGELFPEVLEPTNAFTISNDFVTDSLCVGDDNGQINITASGGTFPYQFEWNTGANTASIDNLLPGNYSLTATDENGCVIQFDTTIAIRAEPLNLSLLSTDLTCFGDNSGFIQAKVICGVPPYQYVWNTGDTTENLINLRQGGYSVTITDAAGGILTETTELRSPPLLEVATPDIEIMNCEGIIELTVTGGISNSYNYTWRNEQGTIISTTNRATGLVAGNYAVTVSDANNCSIELKDLRIDNDAIIDSVITSAVFNRQSNRGTLSVDSIIGGTGPYNYLWFNENNEIVGTSATVTGVVLGNYYVLVADQNSCENRQDQSLDISDPIIELSLVERFDLYPNPTNHSSYLDIQFGERVDVEIALLDAVGRPVLQFKKQRTKAIQREIDLSDYAAGLFYLKITVNDYSTFGEKIFRIKN